jgi:hypothetical protein
MNQSGLIDAVLTDDVDGFAFGASIRKTLICLSSVLSADYG